MNPFLKPTNKNIDTKPSLEISDFTWNTDEPHSDNSETMSDFIENHLDEGSTLIYEDGAHAEVIMSNNYTYELYASGNGDFSNHRVRFELISGQRLKSGALIHIDNILDEFGEAHGESDKLLQMDYFYRCNEDCEATILTTTNVDEGWKISRSNEDKIWKVFSLIDGMPPSHMSDHDSLVEAIKEAESLT